MKTNYEKLREMAQKYIDEHDTEDYYKKDNGIWATTYSEVIFKLPNKKGNMDIGILDKDTHKLTYLYNCYSEVSNADDDSPQLDIEYDFLHPTNK